MKRIYFVALLIILFSKVFSQDVVKLNESNRSLTYDETIAAYTELAKKFPAQSRLLTEGLTDCGKPLHLFIISSDGSFTPESARTKGKTILLINNGIHPGEPDGIDASVRLSQDYLNGKKPLPANVVICIIPVYNIDGSLNRGCCSRANQNGPEAYGFRGNSRNLDLNRDFIKADAANTRSFIKIFRHWDPDVLVDTHVSDGADYQYTMTLISTQHNKLGGPAGVYLKNKMTPALFSLMQSSGNEMSTYVNTSKYDDTPESGIYGFMETPRFATGYAALFQCFGFVTETHMLKPFASRVVATVSFLENVVVFLSENSNDVINARKQTKVLVRSQSEFPLHWKLDSAKYDQVQFKGFEAEYRTSKVTGQNQLYFNRERKFIRPVKFFDTYQPAASVKRPEFYVLPQAWHEVVDRLHLNKVQMHRLDRDSVMEVEIYFIDDFKTVKDPYEGRYLHNSTSLISEIKKVQYYKGDYIIAVNQEANRFIVETLEPIAPDSWFNWGFFDAVLQQKEWFSAYVFDEVAEKLLEENTELKAAFNKKKTEDEEFAKNSFAQLYFIYRNSPNFEHHKRYPVGRIMVK